MENFLQNITSTDLRAYLPFFAGHVGENNAIGKSRDFFKKIRDTKGTFHAKMGTIKDRNGLDLTNRRY